MKKFEFAHVAEGIARQAGALLRDFYQKGVTTEYKGDVDLVTEADRASEKLIVERLKSAFPHHGIYGEEGTRDRLEAEYRWYVDPLDGTTNFAHGLPAFCIILGLEHRPVGLAAETDGEIVAGVIYDPLRDEMFTAEKGRGAWLNGRQMKVSKIAKLGESPSPPPVFPVRSGMRIQRPLLSADHASLPRRAPRRFRRTRSRLCRLRSP